MNKIIKTLIIAITCCLLMSNTTEINEKYFQQVILDNKFSITGLNSINKKRMNCYRFTYNNANKLIKVEYIGSKKGKLEIDPYFGVAQIEIEYTNGYETRRFLNKRDNPMRDNISGVHHIRIKLDKNNDPTSIFNHNIMGELINDKYGVAQYFWINDDNGQRIKSIRLNRHGERIADKEGFYELRAVYNNNNRMIEQLHYDEKGQPITDGDKIAKIKYNYNKKGELVETSYLGSDGQLQESKLFRIAIIRSKFDDNGFLIEQSFYGTDEQLKDIHDNKNGLFAMKRLIYDKHGTLKKVIYYDRDGKIVKRV